MRMLLAAALLIATPAFAQTVPPILPPAAPALPVLPATPSSPANPPPLETWLPRSNVDLTGLDKITARASPLSGKVGQPMTFGTLLITVRSCIGRGPDQPADQAAFLDVTDSRDPGFAFHGWMILSSPGVSVIEHPVYDVRLAACRP